MTDNPVIRAASYCLAHAPELVRYGSKPWREIRKDPSFEPRLAHQLRSFEAAAAYPPNQTFIGNLPPEIVEFLQSTSVDVDDTTVVVKVALDPEVVVDAL